MRTRTLAAALGAALLGSAPASAQQTGNDQGIATETQERRFQGQDNEFPWDLLGLLGLAGLAGLTKRGDSDHGARR